MVLIDTSLRENRGRLSIKLLLATRLEKNNNALQNSQLTAGNEGIIVTFCSQKIASAERVYI